MNELSCKRDPVEQRSSCDNKQGKEIDQYKLTLRMFMTDRSVSVMGFIWMRVNNCNSVNNMGMLKEGYRSEIPQKEEGKENPCNIPVFPYVIPQSHHSLKVAVKIEFSVNRATMIAGKSSGFQYKGTCGSGREAY